MFLLTNNTGYNIYRVFLRCENGLAKKKKIQNRRSSRKLADIEYCIQQNCKTKTKRTHMKKITSHLV